MRDKYVHKSFAKLVKGYCKHTTRRPVNRWQIQGCQWPFCNSIFIIRPEKPFHPAREAISRIMKKSYICGEFIDLVECNIQGRIEGGGNGGNCPGPSAPRGPRDNIYLFWINWGRWSSVDTFLHFQQLLLYFKSKQAQNLLRNKATLYTQYHAKTWKQRRSEKTLQSI